MIDRNSRNYLWQAAALFGGIGALVYVQMITVTLAKIQAVSGQVPFDMRPLGYNVQDAAALLEGLGAEGRSYYLHHQIPLDTAYPALFAATLISLILWFGRWVPANRISRLGIILCLAAALCDYGENLGVVTMILSWPDLSAPVVYASSAATMAKSIATTGAILLTFLLGFLAVRDQLRWRNNGPSADVGAAVQSIQKRPDG